MIISFSYSKNIKEEERVDAVWCLLWRLFNIDVKEKMKCKLNKVVARRKVKKKEQIR